MNAEFGYPGPMNRESRFHLIIAAAPVLALVAGAGSAACGGAPSPEPQAATTPATTSAQAPPAPTTPAPTPSAETASTPAPEPAEAVAEKCEGGWVCVKVSLDSRKVEPRETKLLGDPKIESTWSKNTDGRPATFDAFSKGAVEVTLRRKPGNKNEVVVKPPKGSEIVIDRHDGSPDDFTHVGVIATEKDGALLVDLRYLR